MSAHTDPAQTAESVAKMPSTLALVEALRWAVRDGRAHGVSACTCPFCRNARAVLRLAELAHIDGVDRER